MANRNRSAGHKWERDLVKGCAKALELEPYTKQNETTAQVGTSRFFSKRLDNMGVDLWFDPSAIVQPIYIQAKCTGPRPNYVELLAALPEDGLRVIAHRHVRKAGSKFMTQGEYAILPMEDFYKLLSYAMDRIRSK